MDNGVDKMAGLPEIEAFGDIIDEANSSNQQMVAVNTRLKTSKIYVNKYEEKLVALDAANVHLRKELKARKIQNLNYKSTLESLQIATSLLLDNNFTLKNVLMELQEYNKNMNVDTQKTVDKYTNQLTKRVEKYENSPLAVKRNNVKKTVKLLEFKLMMRKNDLKNFQNAAKMYNNICDRRIQISIVAFAQHMMNVTEKREYIFKLKADIRLKKQEYEKYLIDKNEILQLIERNSSLNNMELPKRNLQKIAIFHEGRSGLPTLNFSQRNVLSWNFSTEKIRLENYDIRAKITQQANVDDNIILNNSDDEMYTKIYDAKIIEEDMSENSPKIIKIYNEIDDKKKIKIISDVLLTKDEAFNLLDRKCEAKQFSYCNDIKSMVTNNVMQVKSYDAENFNGNNKIKREESQIDSGFVNSNKKVHFNEDLTVIEEKMDENQHNDTDADYADDRNATKYKSQENIKQQEDLNIKYGHSEEFIKSKYEELATSKYFENASKMLSQEQNASIKIDEYHNATVNAEGESSLAEDNRDENQGLILSGNVRNTLTDGSNYKSLPSTTMTSSDIYTGTDNTTPNQLKIDNLYNFIDKCEPLSPVVCGSPLGTDYDNFFQSLMSTPRPYMTSSPARSYTSTTSDVNHAYKSNDIDGYKFLTSPPMKVDKNDDTPETFLNVNKTEKAKNKSSFFNFF